ncbi:dTDP-4-dehydrorhamnose reductase [Litorivita pollutaquae]|uniref:dTDP-4-dehydrorhamnose reductase n=1 Tax=Litorivita pollutaquae TaxID=2200892 RepID=A0A2V4NP65_9RHOB|nr:dTDP-4-dehydrorhamnose reductase [Litorivita pollutaquae]PYC46436.1 dTDP-4-dehydrorhamnose reductase [Litorivita pollutaquae]
MMLVFGQTGQVARELARIRPDAVFLGRDRADLSDPAACAAAIRDHAPTAVINAAAWTAVDAAEAEEEAAMVVNGAAPAAMARACADLGVPFVHISTDYVFDGSGTAPFAPDYPTGPLGAYGRTKLAGEEAVRAAGGTHAILRTSWVFSAHGNNFVKTMLRLGTERDALTIVGDQIGGPTPAAGIAAACVTIAEQLIETPTLSGIRHYSGAPDVSWADFAREIFAQAGITCAVTDIPTSDYPTPAARPLNSRMDCANLSDFGLARPDWRAGLTDVLKDLGAIS